MSKGDKILHITQPGDSTPRYTVTIIDPENSIIDEEKMTFAAFIVPSGKEIEWIFSSAEGREILRQNCRVDRVAMILTHQGHQYPDLKGIQDELMDTIVELGPKGFSQRGEKVKFLSLSTNDNDTSSRHIRAQGETEFSGRFVVEDIIENDERFRRLIFLNRGTIIQSEVKLKSTAANEKEEIDFNYISCEYHVLLNIGVSLAVDQLSRNSKNEILVLGLGGGVFTSLLHKCIPQAHIKAIEIDDKIYEMAKQHFYLKEDDKITIEITDGLDYLMKAEKNGLTYDVVIFDVDNKDPTVGISCPPISFLQMHVLKAAAACLNENGLFLMNLVCRSRELRTAILTKLQSIYGGIISMKTSEDVNEVLICWKHNTTVTKGSIETAMRNFYRCSKERDLILQNDILSNIMENMEMVKMM